MSGLFLLRDNGAPAIAGTLDAARDSFARQGLDTPTERRWDGWRLLHFAYAEGGPTLFAAQGEDFVAVAGTITIDGLMGTPALARLLDTIDPLALDWDRIGGQFVAVLRRGGRTFVFADFFAAYQLFHDRRNDVLSTSLLAALAALPRVQFDVQGLYEFAFNVTTIGDDTIFEGIKTLGPDRILELTAHGVIAHPVNRALPHDIAPMSLRERVERNRAPLEAIIGHHVARFGDAINCPLSGGLDSRLVLACLRAAGADPGIYVYGPPDSPDVNIARHIGQQQGFAVDWIEKGTRAVTPDAFPALVERNFQAWDALPNFGNIFDDGSNIDAMHARHAGGALAASGGCGEIYRDFFYLADRPLSAAAIARTFYARFVTGDATAAFEPRRFVDRLADKIAAALGGPAPTEPLPRTLIEQIYPRVRCRALFGREISLESRRSAYLMPFLDHRVVAEAMRLPMALRPAGRFEAMLLADIDPILAGQPSAYGHDFSGPPSRRHRFEEWSSRIRPVWLRQRSYALRRRLGPMGDEHGGILSPDHIGRVLDPEMPAMRRFFNIDAIGDSGLYRRVACLEYLAQYLGGRLDR